WRDWVVRGAKRLAVHCYGTCQQMHDVVQWYLENTFGDLYITECNPGAGNTFDLAAWARDELVPFLDWCATQPRVKLVAYFAWRWDQSPTLPSSVDAANCPALVDVLTTWRPPEVANPAKN